MFDNHLYNLMLQMVEEHKALWRIRRLYKKDAKNCKKCKVFWSMIEKDKQAHIKELQQIVKAHLE